jgi:hypothetical protein
VHRPRWGSCRLGATEALHELWPRPIRRKSTEHGRLSHAPKGSTSWQRRADTGWREHSFPGAYMETALMRATLRSPSEQVRRLRALPRRWRMPLQHCFGETVSRRRLPAACATVRRGVGQRRSHERVRTLSARCVAMSLALPGTYAQSACLLSVCSCSFSRRPSPRWLLLSVFAQSDAPQVTFSRTRACLRAYAARSWGSATTRRAPIRLSATFARRTLRAPSASCRRPIVQPADACQVRDVLLA